MLRLVVCCGGGMSSSVLSVQFQKTIDEHGWQDKVSIAYLPLLFLQNRQEEFDLALLCPHLIYHAKAMVEKKILTLPLYIIPSRIYGSMKLIPLLEDAADILQIFNETHENPVHFPNENYLETKRDTSHRRWIQKHPEKKV